MIVPTVLSEVPETHASRSLLSQRRILFPKHATEPRATRTRWSRKHRAIRKPREPDQGEMPQRRDESAFHEAHRPPPGSPQQITRPGKLRPPTATADDRHQGVFKPCA